MSLDCVDCEQPVKRLDITTQAADYWRDSNGNLPDFVNDPTKPINHLGSVTVGSNVPTANKIATFVGDIDVQGQIDPNSIVFSDAPAGVVTAFDSITTGYYKIGVIGTQRTLVLMPITDVVDAIQFRKANGSTVFLDADSLNGRIGFNVTTPKGTIDVDGTIIDRPLTLSNFTANGVLGPSSTTVDKTSSIAINQTLAGITVSIPIPTLNQSGQLLFVANIGTQSITLDTTAIASKKMAVFLLVAGVWYPIAASGGGTATNEDFWRSGNGTVKPDGTTDPQDTIARVGDVGIGQTNADTTGVAAKLDVVGAQILRPITLANFTANGVIGTAPLTVDAGSLFVIPQTTPNITISLQTPTKLQAGRFAIVRNTGTVAFLLSTAAGNIKVWPGAQSFLTWGNPGWNPEKIAPYVVPIQFNGNLTLQPVAHHFEILEYTGAGNATVTVPNTLPVGFQVSFSQVGAGRITFVGSGGMVVNNRWSATQTAGQWAKAGIEVRAVNSAILSGDVV